MKTRKPPVISDSCLETMVVAIGLRQTVPNVRQTDAGRLLRLHRIVASAPGPVSETVMITRSICRRASTAMSAPSSCGVTAYLIAFSTSGWSSSEGSCAPVTPRIDLEARPQPVLEAHLLDLEIEFQRLHLLGERDRRRSAR